MEETLSFLEQCDNFWKWLEDPSLTVEALEEFSNTGVIPATTKESPVTYFFRPEKEKKVKPVRNFDMPPSGEFKEGSMWFHPSTQEMFVHKSGMWFRASVDPQLVKDTARKYGIHSYYQSLTHQFKFSVGSLEWVVSKKDIDERVKYEPLETYFERLLKGTKAILPLASS